MNPICFIDLLSLSLLQLSPDARDCSIRFQVDIILLLLLSHSDMNRHMAAPITRHSNSNNNNNNSNSEKKKRRRRRGDDVTEIETFPPCCRSPETENPLAGSHTAMDNSGICK